MKVFIAFAIFAIVAVFGQEEEEISDQKKNVTEMLIEASTACGLELKLEPRYIKNDGYTSHPNISVQACLLACVDNKMGVVDEDGTYNLEHILSYTKSPQTRQRNEDTYGNRIKHCTPLVGKSPCKLSACIHGMPECAYMDVECI